MSSTTAASGTPVPPAPSAAPAAARRRWPRLTLAGRFLAANLVILLVAGVVVGVWIGNTLERSIVDRTAAVTAPYVESLVEPLVQDLDPGEDRLPPESRNALAASGLGNQEIGDRLGLAEKTIRHHMTNILGKLQVRSRVEAALLAAREAMGTPPDPDC